MELKPCPFCGVELVAVKEIWRSRKTNITKKYEVYYHRKTNCILDWSRYHFYNGEEIVEAWNRRATDADD